MRLMAAAGALAVVLLGGCGDEPAAARRPVIEFSASPGLASPAQKLTLARDGKAVLTTGRSSRRTLHIPRAAVHQFELLLERAHFGEMKRYYGPRSSTDTPTYSITFGGHTVRTESGTPPAPPKLWAIVGQFGELIEQATRPFLLRVTVVSEHYLRLTVMPDRTALVDRGSGEHTRRLTPKCFDALRRAGDDLETSALHPGLIVRTLRNPPPSVEITRDFSAFHTRLGKHTPASAAALVKQARAAARSG